MSLLKASTWQASGIRLAVPLLNCAEQSAEGESDGPGGLTVELLIQRVADSFHTAVAAATVECERRVASRAHSWSPLATQQATTSNTTPWRVTIWACWAAVGAIDIPGTTRSRELLRATLTLATLLLTTDIFARVQPRRYSPPTHASTKHSGWSSLLTAHRCRH